MAKTFQTVTSLGTFYKGEIPETLEITFKDADGNVIDLTGYTIDTVIEAVDQSVSGLGAGTSSLSDATNGKTDYAWVAADMNTEGLFRLQQWAGDGSNRFASEVFEYYVIDETAAPDI